MWPSVCCAVLLASYLTAGQFMWSKWKPSTSRCPRQCSQPSGRSLHKRVCLSCAGAKCTRVHPSRCTGANMAKRPCYVPASCRGIGIFTGRWTKWIAQSGCPNQPCPGETQTLARKCVSSGRRVGPFRCPPEAGVESIARRKCPCARAVSSHKQQMQQQLRSHMHGHWEEWGAWTCLKDCSSSDVKAYRKRRCTNFMAGYYCRPGPSGVREAEEAPCQDQFGMKCFKKWASWGDWSHCSSSCGGDTMIRQRHCQGFGSPCPGRGKDYQPCPVQRNCPVIDGRWGSWGRWELDCSVTCGDGVRKRYRLCNNPAPSGGGRTCEGLKFETRPCEVKVVCPIHGNWTEWSTWDCTVTCGPGGKATRHRKCDNPAPMFGGNFCRGPDKDSMLDCNNMICPTVNPVPDLPAYLLKAIKNHLKNTYYNFLETEGGSAKLVCRSNVTELFFKEFPDAAIKWVFNGHLLKMDLKRMSYRHGDVVITRLVSNDTGVYTCNVEYFPNVTKIVGIYALTVNSSVIDAAPRATEDLNLFCHGAPFGLAFDNLRQKWSRDGLLVKDFGPVAPQSLDPYVVKGAKRGDSGAWTCSVQEAGGGRLWNTSRVMVVVGPPPGLWERLLDPRVLGGLCGALLAVGLLFSGLCARQAQALETRTELYMAEWRKQLTPASNSSLASTASSPALGQHQVGSSRNASTLSHTTQSAHDEATDHFGLNSHDQLDHPSVNNHNNYGCWHEYEMGKGVTPDVHDHDGHDLYGQEKEK